MELNFPNQCNMSELLRSTIAAKRTRLRSCRPESTFTVSFALCCRQHLVVLNAFDMNSVQTWISWHFLNLATNQTNMVARSVSKAIELLWAHKLVSSFRSTFRFEKPNKMLGEEERTNTDWSGLNLIVVELLDSLLTGDYFTIHLSRCN